MIKGRKSYLRASVALGATLTVGAAVAASLWATHAAAQTSQAPVQVAQADPDNPDAAPAAPAGGRGGRGGAAGAGGRGGRGGGRGPVGPPTRVTVPGTVPHYTPITEDMMLHPPAADWLQHYQNYAGWSHSPLKQINVSNVHNLQLRWVWSQDDGERRETPLVHDGIMFIAANVNNKIQALDAKTGDLIWENTLSVPLPGKTNAQRTMALFGNQLFVGTTDTNLYALDARTGKINWQKKFSSVGNDKVGGMMMAGGKLVVALGRCDEPTADDRCFIAAYDPTDGHELWKSYTVAYTGEPGGDSWGKMPDATRAGADAWISGTYDPQLNLTYWGTGQAKSGPSGPDAGDKLYSNATIALDNDTGKLKWYYQPAPDQGLDLDEVFEKVLIDEGSQKVLITSGKKGILWKVDRADGHFLDYVPMVFQNVFTSIDRKTGRGTYRDDILVRRPDGSRSSCPAASGGHNWPASSYVPENDEIIFPLDQICVTTTGDTIGNYEAPASDGNIARLSAYRAKDLKPLWTIQQRAPFLTSSMTTAGGVGFIGDWDRTFRAFDVKTGKTLWTVRLGTTAQGFPVAYSVGGEEFIAVPTGYNGGSPEARPDAMLAFEKNRSLAGHAVYVFALPKAAAAAPAKKKAP